MMTKFKGKPVGDAFKVKHKKNKKTKIVLTFDEDARQDWLTGFKKRKDERRKKAQEAEIAQLKEEKRLVKAKKREELKKLRENERGVPEMEKLFEKETTTYELEDHTVQITDVSVIDFVGSSGVMLGSNDMEEPDVEGDNAVAENDEPKATKSETTKGAGSGSKKPNKAKGKKPHKRKHINKTHLMDKKRKHNQHKERKELVRKPTNKRSR